MSNVDLTAKIPNNVDLSQDKRLLRALEQWQPDYLKWWQEMGPTDFQDKDIWLRTAISVDAEGWAQLRLREDARLPLGHLPGRPGARPQDRLRRQHRAAGVAGGAGRASQRPAPADRHPGRHRAGQRRAAAPARPHRAQPLRPAQPVPGERRGGPPPLGDGLPAAQPVRPRRPRGGRGAAAAPQRQPRQAAHPRRLQRAGGQLARLLHVHDVHRPRRQVSAPRPGRERLRSALAHDALHAHRGGPPHVRGRDRRRAHRRSAAPSS